MFFLNDFNLIFVGKLPRPFSCEKAHLPKYRYRLFKFEGEFSPAFPFYRLSFLFVSFVALENFPRETEASKIAPIVVESPQLSCGFEA